MSFPSDLPVHQYSIIYFHQYNPDKINFINNLEFEAAIHELFLKELLKQTSPEVFIDVFESIANQEKASKTREF